MDQDTLQAMLREAMRETVAEFLQTLLNLDREAFLAVHLGKGPQREARWAQERLLLRIHSYLHINLDTTVPWRP